MASYELALAGLKAIWAAFLFAFGACAGSLINVLVYRMPRGLGVVTPPSRCPACGTRLTWRENIPVLGWIALGGKCRFCRSRISAEYPLVEALVGGLFVLLFVLYYAVPGRAVFLGVDWGAVRPEWAGVDSGDGWPATTWPIFVVHLLLAAGLVAMTLVDAKTFTIPLGIPWAITIAAIALHTAGAVLVQFGPKTWIPFAPGARWAIPTPGWLGGSGWAWVGASLGGAVGLAVGMVLLSRGLIRRSFQDYNDWERQALKAQGIDPDAPPASDADDGVPVGEHVGPGVRLVLSFVVVWAACIAAGAVLGHLVAGLGLPAWTGLAVGAGVGPLAAALACRWLAPVPPDRPAQPPAQPVTSDEPGSVSRGSAPPAAPDLWIAYPHARREMLKELIFITPCLAFGWGAAELVPRIAEGATVPLWLSVLCGTVMGYLIGGGVVWAIRIFGSLAFGKEAMGLGDVHLMGAVGACLGWVDAAIAVPLAAIVGLYFVVAASLAGRPAGRAMPFGPYLAVATFLVMMGKPLIELGLTHLLGGGVPGSPAVNLP